VKSIIQVPQYQLTSSLILGSGPQSNHLVVEKRTMKPMALFSSI
jgi:hypothetical protein